MAWISPGSRGTRRFDFGFSLSFKTGRLKITYHDAAQSIADSEVVRKNPRPPFDQAQDEGLSIRIADYGTPFVLVVEA